MKRLFLVLGTAVVVLPWLAGARAQADAIQWTANTVIPGGENFIFAQPSTPFAAGMQMFDGGTPNEAGITRGTNSESLVLTHLQTSPGGLSSQVYTFSGPSAHYQLNLGLTDQASGASGTLTFRGFFGGSFGGDIDALNFGNLTNTFIGPTTQSLKLGSNLYTVTLGPVVLPDHVLNANVGSISASIAVQPSTNATPEPSSLVLACLGLPSLGLARWFRRRKGVNSIAGQA